MKKEYDIEDFLNLCARIEALVEDMKCPCCGEKMEVIEDGNGFFYDCACGYGIGFDSSRPLQ